MKNREKKKQLARALRHRRVRAKIYGTSKRPRLSVFRSLRYLHVQLIDDKKGEVLLGLNSRVLENRSAITKTEQAKELGKLFAKKSLEKGIERVVFDRGGYKYHGRVKAFADGAREGGLKF